jgi:hypothetical protein
MKKNEKQLPIKDLLVKDLIARWEKRLHDNLFELNEWKKINPQGINENVYRALCRENSTFIKDLKSIKKDC